MEDKWLLAQLVRWRPCLYCPDVLSTTRLACLALTLCLSAETGCHKKCSEMSRCPGGDDYDGDACGCKPVAAASLAANREADPYPCGERATCDGVMQTCEHVRGGAPPGVEEHRCITLPADCERDVSCGCLMGALRARGASECAGEGRHLTVRIDVP